MVRLVGLIVTCLVALAPRSYAGEKPAAPKDDSLLPAEIQVPKPKGDVNSRIEALEQSVTHLEAEVEILRTQNQMVIQHTHFNYNDATYLSAGMALLLPRAFTFPISTDTGLGAHVGIGRYLGQRHAFELTVLWDVHLAADLQYRFELQTGVSRLTLGPVVGYRTKIADLHPFDRFVSDPSRVNNSFYYFGANLGLPTSGSTLLRGELLIVTNSQQIFTARVSVNFLL